MKKKLDINRLYFEIDQLSRKSKFIESLLRNSKYEKNAAVISQKIAKLFTNIKESQNESI